MGIIFVFVEGNKLNNVSLAVLLVFLTVKSFFVAIESLHVAEVGIPCTHNDYSHGVARASHDFVNRLSHIINDTIGDD
jgi:hypothetical protein